MATYVLHTTRADGPTTDELALIGRQCIILDQSHRALLVDIDATDAAALATQLPGWTVQPETIMPIPDLKRRLK